VAGWAFMVARSFPLMDIDPTGQGRRPLPSFIIEFYNVFYQRSSWWGSAPLPLLARRIRAAQQAHHATSGTHPYVQNTYDTTVLGTQGLTDFPVGRLT